MNAPAREVTREDLISRSSAAKQLRVHVNTLDRTVRKLHLTRYKVLGDSQVYFHRQDIGSIEYIEVVGEEPV
jgi:hypothetical protein